MVKLTINNKEVTASPDKTILQVCHEQNIDRIPTLCYDEQLPPFGSCFLCVVEVEGQSKMLPSCSAKVADGMKIFTRSEKVKAARKTCLELLLSDHYADCFGPCRLRCPADVDIQGYMSLVNLGKPKEAIALIKEKLPFPSVCGRVCTRKCEVGCRRSMVDSPVGIDFLKRYAADQDMIDEMWQPETKPDNGNKVAIIGGGPAGLTAAYYLVIEGYRPTVFESLPELGGMLKYGIPEYRLPKKILDKEIDWITDLGVEVQVNKTLGKDIQIDDLFKQGYKSVFVGLGAQVGKPMRVENEDVDGVLSGVEFLKQVQMNTNDKIYGRVVVVGGGNTAIDAARTSLRLGAKEVVLLYRRTRNEMPANLMEIEAAEEEGVKMEFLAAPVKANATDGRIDSLECIRMELGEPDESGRRRPVVIKGSEYKLECDWVISAIGQEADLTGVDSDKKIEVTSWKTIEAKKGTFETDRPGVFSGGDVVTGPADAVDAIAAGRMAARAIDKYIKTGIAEPLVDRFESKRDNFHKITAEDIPEVLPSTRHSMPEMSVMERITTFEEVECGYTDEMAQAESLRCAECGCDVGLACLLQDYCTEYGVDQNRFVGEYNRYKVDTRHPFVKIDSNKCIRCGRCVSTCSEILNVSALGFVNRGFRTIVKPAMEKALNETNCVSCGNCIDVCPTGALVEKMPFRRSGPWKMESIFNVCNYCAVGCNITLNVKTDDIFFVTGAPPDRGPNLGELCVKGRFGYQQYLDGSRLKEPMVRKNGKLEPASWDEALKTAIDGLRNVSNTHKPENMLVTGSPKLTNEELYLVGRIGRAGLKTNNIGSFHTIQNGADYHSLDDMIGSTASTVTNEELLNADLYIFLGGNPTTENPVIGWQMKRRMKHGTEAIVINSAQIDLVTYASAWADARRGSSTTLINGIINELHNMGAVDKNFIDQTTENYDAFINTIKNKSLDEVSIITGVAPDKIKMIAELLSDKNKKVVAVYNIDSRIDRSTNDLKALTTLMLALGKVNVPGSGLAVLSSQCNLNGMRLVGLDSILLPGGVTVDHKNQKDEVARLWQTELDNIIPEKVPSLNRTLSEDRIRGALIVGENPAAEKEYNSMIDNLEFLVVVDSFDTATVQMADVFLPLGTYLENEGQFTNWSGMTQKLNPIGKPATNRSNIDLLQNILESFSSEIGPKNYDELVSELDFLIHELKIHSNGSKFKTLDGKAHFVPYTDTTIVTSAERVDILEIDARMKSRMKLISKG